MRAQIDKRRFGPWAVITGASSGIGKEFARQIAASGVHVALVGRREPLLRTVGAECTQASGVQHRIIPLDLSEPDFLPVLADATRDLDVGLVVSNAGTGNPGAFLKLDRQLLQATLRLSTMAHMDITHHFGAKLAERRRGGLILVGAMGANSPVTPLRLLQGKSRSLEAVPVEENASVRDPLRPKSLPRGVSDQG